ncbi:hypothetical protein LXL04_006725 [Taraxacum kok-saghyz]
MWDQSSKRTVSDISKTPASQKPLIDINVRRFLPPTPASQNQSLQRRRKRRPRLLLPTSASEGGIARRGIARRGKNAYQWGPIASNFGIARRGFAEAEQLHQWKTTQVEEYQFASRYRLLPIASRKYLFKEADSRAV